MLRSSRQASKQPVPKRNAGEGVVEAVVGKRKQGNKKFIYWSKQGGGQYAKNTCTWESVASDLGPRHFVTSGRPPVSPR